MKHVITSLFALLISVSAMADEPMTRLSDGTYVVNTTTLCKTRGYKWQTPLEVYIKGNKVVKIEPLKNKETPKYYAIATKGMFAQFLDKKVSKCQEITKRPEVDGCTGATFSAKAIKDNVKAALDYYKKNK